MKLKDITNISGDIVRIVKLNSPKGTKVKVYERGHLLYIYSTHEGSRTLSVSSADGRVTERDCFYGAKKILNLNPEEIVLLVRPTGVVFIREKSELSPLISGCYH